jgi:hypothetical protein
MVDGERLPCVHAHWVSGKVHLDPNYDPADPKFLELAESIEAGQKVILTRDTVVENDHKRSGIGFVRTGYIAVFRVEDVIANDNGLRFELTERMCDLN